MSIPDKDHRYLSDIVYTTDPKHSKYNPDIKQNTVIDAKGSDYRVLKLKDNTSNGMQAMAVAPVNKDGKVDMSKVVIAYAGTNSDDNKDIQTDIQTVALGSEKLTLDNNPVGSRASDVQGNGSGFDPKKVVTTDSQATTALLFADEIKRLYPHAEISTTGHSLGEYLALLAAAENKWRNVGFNGADPYGILSEKAKKWVKNHPGMLTNYRNRGDAIRLNGNGTGAEIMISLEMGFKNPLDYHSLSNWKFDKDGKLLIPNNDYNQKALLKQSQHYLMGAFALQLSTLSDLEKRLTQSGGGLSSNEKIYLDNQLALTATNTARKSYQSALAKVITTAQTAIQAAEQRWTNTLKEARKHIQELSESEMMSVLAEVGFTKQSIIVDPTEYFQSKIDQAKAMDEKFEKLSQEITNKIHELLKRDQELAEQLK
ncbi:lipase [Vagococcus entomophilus]|uniref:Fungal lipase-like domain-containing protein n=1 Tax=Vagococcus entomophilus TaxID=1160095 RepID=A0A430AF10_9ENTE|nr:lipase [Vagococcus entomophilus]RSU06167.1 hypothetical protein CBF30_10645 [Vagococcus entomophilus]